MGDVAVETPANNVTPLTKAAPLDTIPNIDSLEGTGNDGSDEYATLKRLQRHLEYVPTVMMAAAAHVDSSITGTFNFRRSTSRMSKGKLYTIFVRDYSTRANICYPYRSLKRELVRAQEEIKRIQSVPLVIGQFMEAIDQKYGAAQSFRHRTNN